MSQSSLQVEALTAALGGSDNEKKTTSLTGLKDELESIDVLPDYGSLLPLLKTALDSSNGHVSFGALSCILPMVNSLSTHHQQSWLKQIVATLYAPTSGNGVMTLLGDSKQRVRETARATLSAASMAVCEIQLQSNQPPGSNEVLQDLERIVKEHGFANKTARARVQILHYVRELRSRYPTVFQLKAYLPSMISLLEDSDASVRSSASETIITVFQDPSIPPSARADLKNELGKQGIRKSTVDVILPKVFESQCLTTTENTISRAGSLSPPRASSSGMKTVDERATIASMVTPALPPSSVPTSSITDVGQSSGTISPVYITSSREMESEFAKMLAPWEGKETEHNWQVREGNVNRLRGMIKSNAHLQYTLDFISGLKSISDGLLKSLASLRTTSAVGACTFLQEASSLGTSFDSLLEIFLPPLLRMAAQTKKIVFSASQNAATALIQSTSYNTRTLQFLFTSVNEKTVQARTAGISRLQGFIEVHGQRSKAQIESGGGLALIDKSLKKTLADPSPIVRQTAREVYWICSSVWPSMTEALMETLDGPTRKQLEKASNGLLSSTSTSKPSSVPVQRVSVRSMIKSTRSMRTASGPASVTQGERATSNNTLRKSDSLINTPPLNRTQSHLAKSQGHLSKSPDFIHSKLNSSTTLTGISQVTPPRQGPLTRSTRIPHPIPHPVPSSTSVSPLRKSVSVRSQTSNHMSTKPIPSNKIRALSRQPSSSSDSGIPSRTFRSRTKEEETHRFGHSNKRVNLMQMEEGIVEDAMKAQAEQAESAAHRLLELTEDELLEVEPMVPLGPGGVLISSTKNESTKISSSSGLVGSSRRRSEELMGLRELNLAKLAKVNKLEDVTIWKKMFENSPAHQPHHHQTHHLVADLRNRMRDSWWHRQAELTMCGALNGLSRSEVKRLVEEVCEIEKEIKGEVYINLSQACVDHGFKVMNHSDPSNPSNREDDQFWIQEKLFDLLFDGLRDRLRQESLDSIRDHQLILLRAMILYESHLMVGKETELCTILLETVQSAPSSVMIACEAIGLMWVEQTEPVYGLSCLRSAVEMMKEERIEEEEMEGEEEKKEKKKSGERKNRNLSIRLAVICVGEYFGRLPMEIIEEALPKTKELIKEGLMSEDPETRMSSVMSLVIANSIMKDEKQIMRILGSLSKSQEALLTYYLTPDQIKST
ncbi:clasp N terminal-domain-containing protein [Melampsora americana]|nr:clasp N terminal-domain-containing protein [Melampsora americana]